MVETALGSVRRRGSAPGVGAILAAAVAAGCSGGSGAPPAPGCVGAGPSQLVFSSVGTLTAGVTTPVQVRIVDRCGAATSASAQIVLRVDGVDPTIWIPTPGVASAPGAGPRLGPAPDGYPLAANPVPTKVGTIGYPAVLTGAYAMGGGAGAGSVTVAIAEGGVATFHVTLTGANRYRLRADSTAYGSAVSDPFTVEANPELAMLVWKQQPQNVAGLASPGAQFRSRIAVAAADQYGNIITTLRGLTVGVSCLGGDGALETGADGNVVALVTAPTVNGVATFQDLRVVPTTPPAAGAPVGFQLRATATRGTQWFQTDSDAFQLVNPDDPAALVFVTEPADHASDNAQPPNVRGTRIRLGMIKADGTPWAATAATTILVTLPYALGDRRITTAPTAVAAAAIAPSVPRFVLGTAAGSGEIVSLTIPPGSSETPLTDVQVANLARTGTAGTYYLGAIALPFVQGVTLTPAVSRLFTVSPGPAYTLAWATSPLNVGPAPRATRARIVALDAQGNLASSFTGNVAVSVDVDGGGATSLNGAPAHAAVEVAATQGVADASFTFDRAGAGPFSLAADFAVDPAIVDTLTLPARSWPFMVLAPGAAARLVFTRQPTTAAAGATIGAPDVRVQAVDVDGDPVIVPTTAFVWVWLAPPHPVVSLGEAGGFGVDHDTPPPLDGTTFRAGDGLGSTVVFDDLSVGGLYHARPNDPFVPYTASCLYRLQASSPEIPGNATARSAPFDVTPTINDVYAPGFPGLAFTNGDYGGLEDAPGVIGNQVQGAPLISRAPGFGTIVVRLLDENGNIITDIPTTVYLHLVGDPPGVLLGGMTSTLTVGGVAIFPDLTIDAVGTYQLVATSPDFPQAVSAPFDVVAP